MCYFMNGGMSKMSGLVVEIVFFSFYHRNVRSERWAFSIVCKMYATLVAKYYHNQPPPPHSPPYQIYSYFPPCIWSGSPHSTWHIPSSQNCHRSSRNLETNPCYSYTSISTDKQYLWFLSLHSHPTPSSLAATGSWIGIICFRWSGWRKRSCCRISQLRTIGCRIRVRSYGAIWSIVSLRWGWWSALACLLVWIGVWLSRQRLTAAWGCRWPGCPRLALRGISDRDSA